MRQWSRFLSCRDKFESLLKQYDPAAFSREVEADWARVRNVEDCLGGQTARADANAIMKWATMLARDPGYFNALNELKSGMGAKVHDGEIVPVLATFLGSPSKRAEKRWPPPSGTESWKAPGMGMVLASEFLRNLHWDGFKPDRHSKRLIVRWFPDVIEAKSGRASDLARGILYRGSKDVIIGLKISLAGMAVTPNDCSFTKADNLVSDFVTSCAVLRHWPPAGANPARRTVVPAGSNRSGSWRQRHGLKHSAVKGSPLGGSASMQAGIR